MNKIVRILFFINTILLTALSLFAADAVMLGSSYEDVLKEFGQPNGELQDGDELILSYSGGIIAIKDGKVVAIDDNFRENLEKRKKENMLPKRKQSPSSVQPEPTQSRAKSGAKTLLVISNAGEEIQMKDLLAPGKITIIDFFADWCGPCRRLAPFLEGLAENDSEVAVRKIDIVQWGTPVANQYQIESIPNVRVYDRTGKMVGKPTSQLSQIKEYINQAKRK